MGRHFIGVKIGLTACLGLIFGNSIEGIRSSNSSLSIYYYSQIPDS